jgi:regulator of RNase E activity RraA
MAAAGLQPYAAMTLFLAQRGITSGIVPLWPRCPKIIGRATTMKLVPLEQGAASPVLGTLEAILAGRPGDVLVIDHGGRMDVNSKTQRPG